MSLEILHFILKYYLKKKKYLKWTFFLKTLSSYFLNTVAFFFFLYSRKLFTYFDPFFLFFQMSGHINNYYVSIIFV